MELSTMGFLCVLVGAFTLFVVALIAWGESCERSRSTAWTYVSALWISTAVLISKGGWWFGGENITDIIFFYTPGMFLGMAALIATLLTREMFHGSLSHRGVCTC